MNRYQFTEVITDITSKFNKIKSSDYKNEGRFKIIDQGQTAIAGYTDDESLVNTTHSPVIIFGDHTRVLKYEDTPIALGADGVKALAVNPKMANTLYVYYFLRSINLKAAGYSRHFKFLKQVAIPIPEKDGKPSLDDQKRIAHLLGKVEGLIARRKQHLQQLDELLKSVFLEMFGDPVRNEKGWEKKTAIDYADCIVPGRDKPKNFTGDIPWVTTNDLNHLAFTQKSNTNIGLTQEEIDEVRARVIPQGSVLLTCVGDLGICSLCAVNMVVNQQLHAFQVRNKMSNCFFMYALSFQKAYMYQFASKTTVPYMNKNICNKTPMISPPITLQNQFAAIVEKVESLKSRYQSSLSNLENLYGVLSQKAFKGELDLSRVPMEEEAR